MGFISFVGHSATRPNSGALKASEVGGDPKAPKVAGGPKAPEVAGDAVKAPEVAGDAVTPKGFGRAHGAPHSPPAVSAQVPASSYDRHEVAF